MDVWRGKLALDMRLLLPLPQTSVSSWAIGPRVWTSWWRSGARGGSRCAGFRGVTAERQNN